MTIFQIIGIVAIYALLVCLPSLVHYILITMKLRKIDKEYNRLFKRD